MLRGFTLSIFLIDFIRQNKVPGLQNLYSPLQVEEPPQQILVEENNSTVLSKERNTILDYAIRRKTNICTTERYILRQ